MTHPVRVIPVLDVLNGVVVRGVAGRRSEYRPIVSQLVADPSPATVAAAFARRGYTTAYLADLDAILGGPPSWSSYETIHAAGLDQWIDAGVSDLDRAVALANHHDNRPIAGIILGLETIPDESFLRRVAERVDPARLIFSLDLKNNEPLTRVPAWRSASPKTIVAAVVAAGIERVIVLDLARVGVNDGVGTEPLLRELHVDFPHLELIAGGGVRHRADLDSLTATGCTAALVASALHDGRLP